MMIINLDDPRAYEYLSLIIDAYETAAIKSESRTGMTSVLQSPLSGYAKMVNQSANTLQTIKSNRTSGESRELIIGENIKNISWDKDLLSVFGNDNIQESIRKAIEECIGCNLRVGFEWEVNPFNLLLPIAQLLASINAQLDKLLQQLDPTRLLDGFCQAMNNFNLICIDDWIAILVSIKLLIKKYVSTSLGLKIDWTTVLGPILKAIVSVVSQFIQQITGILTAPLDCAVTALNSFEQLEKEARNLGAYAEAFGTKLASGGQSGSFSVEFTDVDTQNVESKGTILDNLDKLVVDKRKSSEQAQGRASFLSGIQAKKEESVADYLDKEQHDSFTEPIKIVVQEARKYIKDLENQLLQAVKSLNGLAGGGMKLQFEAIGTLLFLTDIIGLVLTIISLLRNKQGIKDWCSYLQENPQVLEDELRQWFYKDAKVLPVYDSTNPQEVQALQVSIGNATKTIPTCISARTVTEQSQLNQWIADLKGHI